MDRLRSFNSRPTSESLKKFRLEPPTPYEQEYLLGVRGLLTLSTFTWVFLQTFLPVTVEGSANTEGPFYQIVLRKTFSVIFWNENLLYSSFILLSGRSIAIPFIKDPSRRTVAGCLFRRGLTLWFPVAVALAIVKIAFTQGYEHYIFEFKQQTGNKSFAVPYRLPNAFTYFNAVFELFWKTRNYAIQAGSTAFPSQTLWVVNALYQQSYTVYLTMVIIPWTRPRWRVQMAFAFVITAWWVQSWGWFTITGLTICDMVMNMDFKTKAKQGVPIWGTGRRLPYWIPTGAVLLAGLIMQYVWTAWKPSLASGEYIAHSDMYKAPGLNVDDNISMPQARDDNYLVLLGFFLFLEASDFLQRVFRTRFLVFLGRRSFSMSFRPKFPPSPPLFSAFPC